MKHLRRMAGAVFIASALMATSVAPAFAANTATTNDLSNADIIDSSKKGSLSIYKYDITSAEEDGQYAEGFYKATGEKDATLESTMADYAVEGVEFTYLRCGNVETCSVDNGTENFVELVYEIPDGLREILGLSTTTVVPAQDINESKNAVDMTADVVSTKCSNTGVYHYTSEQINNALADILKSDNIKAKDALEEYIESAGAVKMAKTDASGYTHVDNLELGLYLVIETEVPEEVVDTVNPWFVQLPFTNTSAQTANADGSYDKDAENGGQKWLYDMTCYPKNQTGNPTLDKLVRNAYNTSINCQDNNGTVDTADTFKTDGNNLKNHMIVFNDDKSEDADSYVANRGGYTEDGVTAGEAAYSSDFTYDSSTTASEGDVLDYILVSKLPRITSEATYLTRYTFVDVLSEGIEYGQDARVAIYSSEADAMANNTKNAVMMWSADGNYNQEYTDVTVEFAKTGETTMTVSFTELGLKELNTKYSEYYVVVFYTATVNSDATAVLGDAGNPNDVVLTWERTSQGFYNTLEDRCYVYTYGIDLTKTFSDNAGDPTKVQFVLYDETDGYYVISDNTETVNGKLVYYVTGKTISEDEATKFTPNSDGSMVINGLEGDKYHLTEIETDDGYSLLKDQIVIDITTATRDVTAASAGYVGKVDADHVHTDACYAVDANGTKIIYTDSDGESHNIYVCGHTDADANGRTTGKSDMVVSDVVASSTTVDDVSANMLSYGDSENALVQMKVVNSKSFLLPRTGGNGMLLLAVAGVVLVAAGGYFVLSKKKKNPAENTEDSVE